MKVKLGNKDLQFKRFGDLPGKPRYYKRLMLWWEAVATGSRLDWFGNPWYGRKE
jgi:hypothetical protein